MIRSESHPEYQQCKVSLMDNIADPDIVFDEDGTSNYFHQYKRMRSLHLPDVNTKESKLLQIIGEIKKAGSGKKYDCIIGISGGVDSSYVAYKAKELNLHALLVHFDNGWNSETAVSNINNLVNKLGFDLFTYVVDWEEFKDLQVAYIKSGVIDIEVLTDHAIIAVLHKLALKFSVSYILSGTNATTESTLPKSWIWSKTDHVNIQQIHSKFGSLKLKSYPFFDRLLKKTVQFKKIKVISILNYLNYEKAIVKKTIASELNWKDYGVKHGESIFTKFYQCHILPQKFAIDKRKAHLSDLIFSEQITKTDALKLMQEELYSLEELIRDRDFVLKKLNLSSEYFQEWLTAPPVQHSFYGYEKSIWHSNVLMRKLFFIRKKFA
jgi:N-acetyl sugar amidotransferase